SHQKNSRYKFKKNEIIHSRQKRRKKKKNFGSLPFDCLPSYLLIPIGLAFENKPIAMDPKLQLNDAISVAVRVRPLNAKESKTQAGAGWTWDETSLTQFNPLTNKSIPNATYTF